MSVAFVFPGQGSQSKGMLSELAQSHPLVQSIFTQASEVLGYDLWRVVQENPDDQLSQTQITQPAMLVAGYACFQVYSQTHSSAPSFMAGHSLGEYTALVAAGALSFEDAVRLVSLRGQYMQEAVPEGVGAMAAILGLSDEAVAEVCAQAAQDQVCAPVNFNSPGQVVVAGHRAGVERATELAKAAGAKRALILPVSVPSHCSLMMPAAERLAKVMETMEFNLPQVPVIQNATVASAASVEEIKAVLVRQLYSPVRWVETVEYLARAGVTHTLEMGPGKVLSGLNKRIVKDIESLGVYDNATLDKALGL
jgi:[acyl-carrier-protein] S-malonyltransferase